jgi:putative ABC transport system ATP-binding protein
LAGVVVLVSFQDFKLLPELSAWDNIVLPLTIAHLPIDKERIMNIVTEMEIDDKVKKYPSELSGGEKQRVVIARALAYVQSG